MSRTERMAQVAQNYVDGQLFAGIEWQVEQAGQTLSHGQVGHADAQSQQGFPEQIHDSAEV